MRALQFRPQRACRLARTLQPEEGKQIELRFGVGAGDRLAVEKSAAALVVATALEERQAEIRNRRAQQRLDAAVAEEPRQAEGDDPPAGVRCCATGKRLDTLSGRRSEAMRRCNSGASCPAGQRRPGHSSTIIRATAAASRAFNLRLRKTTASAASLSIHIVAPDRLPQGNYRFQVFREDPRNCKIAWRWSV